VAPVAVWGFFFVVWVVGPGAFWVSVVAVYVIGALLVSGLRLKKPEAEKPEEARTG
jgi:DHA1 family tetracycline resistance protein-like MFS transporter